MLFSCLCEVEFHYRIVFELGFTDYVQTPFILRKYCESSQEFISCIQTSKIFYDEIRVLSKFYEEILIRFDSFEFPLVAFKKKVEINFSITREFYFNSFRKIMLVLHHYLDSDLLGLFKSLHHLWFFLNFYDEAVLIGVYYVATISYCRIVDMDCWLKIHQIKNGSVCAFIHLCSNKLIQMSSQITSKSKQVSGKGQATSVQCHHSLSQALNPFFYIVNFKKLRLLRIQYSIKVVLWCESYPKQSKWPPMNSVPSSRQSIFVPSVKVYQISYTSCTDCPIGIIVKSTVLPRECPDFSATQPSGIMLDFSIKGQNYALVRQFSGSWLHRTK